MATKLQKICAEIERTKAKIAELQASLPALEKQREELENSEWVKALRTANVAPADFTAFIETYKANLAGGARPSTPPAPRFQPKMTEEMDNEA